MKKNSEYVGVDERFIPEEEKYVNNEENEISKEQRNKMVKGYKTVTIGIFGFIILVFIIVFAIVISNILGR